MGAELWTVGADTWQAIGSMVTAVIAFGAGGIAGWQAREARRLRKDQAQPYVIVDFEQSVADRHITMLSIENLGLTVAYDVKIHFNPALQSAEKDESDGYKPSESRYLTDGLTIMPPRKKITMYIERTFIRAERPELNSLFDVQVLFWDLPAARRKWYTRRSQHYYELIYKLDITAGHGSSWVGERSIHHVATHLEEIAKVAAKRATDKTPVPVAVYDGEQLDRREKQEHRRRLDQIKKLHRQMISKQDGGSNGQQDR